MHRSDVAPKADYGRWPSLGPGFIRAASLEDIERLDELPRLKVTPNIVRAVTQIATSMRGSRERAWAVIGPYGAGKSTFAVLMAALLTERRSSVWASQAIEDLEEADKSLGERLREITRSRVYVPVLLQGGPQSFAHALAERLLEVDASLSRSLLDGVGTRSLLEQTRSGQIRPQSLIRLIERAVRNVHKAGYAGLVFVVDEFGRFLDQLYNTSVRQNLAFTQQLAELGSRTEWGELHLFVVLHQNFEDYALGVTAHERTEWSKIQGRFRQIVLSEDPDNLCELIARCIDMDRSATPVAERAMSEAWELVKDFPPFRRFRDWRSRLYRLFPLHPLAVYALPRLSSRLGQNERTIFSFLLSDEPHSLHSFVRRRQSNGDLSLVGLDWLCEYFLLNHATSFVPLRFRRKLAQLSFALEQSGDKDPLATRIIKVVGILELLDTVELRPTEGVIAAALNIRDDDEWDRYRAALKYLVAQRVLVARRYAGEFRLLPGSDLDVTEALADLADRWRASELDTGEFLNQHLDLPPLIARRHSFESGTVRVAARTFVEATRFQPDVPGERDWKAVNEKADLTIEYLICSSNDEIALAERVARKCRAWDRVVVIPQEPLTVRELAVQVRALQDLCSEEEVKGDPIAAQEAELHLKHVSALLHKHVERLLDPTSGFTRWFWRGKELLLSTERDVQSLISNICAALFSKSPVISNELINRRQLSSASVVAVKKIIAGLLENQHEEHLGFKGNGPEVTIFHAVFERTGWHRLDGQEFRLLPPRRAYRLRPTWNAVQRFLNSTVRERRPLSSLWSELARPPFGIRAGLAPLFIWGALIERRAECCLYERGTYVPTWSPELYDRFLRAPEDFEVRCVAGTPLPAALIRLSETLPAPTSACGPVRGVNDFLQRLFSWYRALPDYTKRTGTVSPRAKEFRRILSSATDPVELVFKQLPESLSLPDLLDAGSTDTYCRRFGRVARELSKAYSTLLSTVVGRVAILLGTTPRIEAVQAELARLGETLAEEVTDAGVKAFLLRAANITGDHMAWVESLAAAVVGQPPRFWSDQTLREFDEQLAIIVHRIRQTQKAQALRSQAGLRPGVQAKWLTLATPGGTLIDDVLLESELPSNVQESLAVGEATLGKIVAGLAENERRQVLIELVTRLWGEPQR